MTEHIHPHERQRMSAEDAYSAHVTFDNDTNIVKKIVKLPLSTDGARRYIGDAQAYEANLRDEGYGMPRVFGYETLSRPEGLLVVQHSELLPGLDLRIAPNAASTRTVINTMADAETRRDGSFVTPVDAKPSNFVPDAEGRPNLIDIMPPLTERGSERFPYERWGGGDTLIGRLWLDRNVVSKYGAITRLVAISAAREHSQPWVVANAPDREAFEPYIGDLTKREQLRIQRNLIPFFAVATLNRVAKRRK